MPPPSGGKGSEMADSAAFRLHAGPDTLVELREYCGSILAPVQDAHLARSAELVLEELVTNIVRHAYGQAGGPIEVDLQVEDERIRLIVADEGPPFDPLSSAALERPTGEGKRGLLLLRHLTSDLHYVRSPDGRNVTTCVIEPTSEPDAE